jgi:hypothetical protein
MKLNSTTGLAFWQSIAISSAAFWISSTAALPSTAHPGKRITHLSTREYISSNSTNATTSNLLGDVFFVGYDNYAFRDDIVAAQMVISANASSSKPSRLIVAFPQGNTGFATYFIPTNGTSSAPLQVVPDIGSLSSVTFSSGSSGLNTTNQTGITCDLSFNSDMSLGVTLIGSIRTVRDYTEGAGLTHEIFNYTLGDFNGTYLQLVRPWINGTTVQYLTFVAGDNTQFAVTPSQNITLPPSIAFERTDKSQNGSMTFSTTFNYTDLPMLAPGLDGQSLFLTSVPTNGNASKALTQVIQALQGNSTSGNSTTSALEEVSQMSFLTYQDKFLAGGWRFLTCKFLNGGIVRF